ncbi:acetyl-CoA carboxylase [Cryobacterium ruanii]|nr:acetyl-CoA carboxylase [Cryobacterium ruanii]
MAWIHADQSDESERMSHQIISPLPGIFYRKPGPGKEPYVNEGETISAGQTIGLVEIMKQFSEVRAEFDGVLEKFEIDDFGIVNPGDVIAITS